MVTGHKIWRTCRVHANCCLRLSWFQWFTEAFRLKHIYFTYIYIYIYIYKNTTFKTSGSPAAGISPGPVCQLLPSCSFHGLLESVTRGWARKRGGGREAGRGKVAFPLAPIFFSLFYICHYYITLFWVSKVVGAAFGSSPAFLPWKSQRVGSGLGFLLLFCFKRLSARTSTTCLEQ